jgi:oligopeptide transport system permease protein
MKRMDSIRRNQTLRRFARNRAAVAGLIIISVFGLMALFAPCVDRHDPSTLHLDRPFPAPPTARYWLGTDKLGRDQYSRLVHGARASLAVGVLAEAVAVGLGVVVGLSAGMGGRKLDGLLMRLTDISFAFPDLLMVILLVSVLGSSASMLVLAIGLVNWTVIARIVRGQVLSLREEEFVHAGRALGASDVRIALHHLLPNLMGPVIVTAAFGVPSAIFAEAALSFIGFGLSSLSWGHLVLDGYAEGRIFAAPYLTLSACSAIALTMMSFTFIGDGLRDALDPRTGSGARRKVLPDAPRPAQPAQREELPRAA